MRYNGVPIIWVKLIAMIPVSMNDPMPTERATCEAGPCWSCLSDALGAFCTAVENPAPASTFGVGIVTTELQAKPTMRKLERNRFKALTTHPENKKKRIFYRVRARYAMLDNGKSSTGMIERFCYSGTCHTCPAGRVVLGQLMLELLCMTDCGTTLWQVRMTTYLP